LTPRRGRINEPRDVAIYLCRIIRNDGLRALGQAFGMRGYGPAGNAVERIKKKIGGDLELSYRIEEIRGHLSTGKNLSK
ncbi:MAG TPA: hypothetical protein EYH36_04830, partial [Desulfocapsa sulfexigens]|nr:hypothetical protein [Desulfocapsa sulfexigens]